jgi:methionyl-tRNA formyltransferase
MINGETLTGVTLFRVDDGMDTGAIIGARDVSIGKGDSASTVFDQIIQATIEVVVDAFMRLEQGTLTFVPQDEACASYTCPRIPDDGYIEWGRSATEIERLINALAPPYPCAFSIYDDTFFKIVTCEIPEPQLNYVGCIPGRPVRILKNQGVEILTGQGTLIIKDIITKEGDRVTADSLIKSVRKTLGISMTDLYRLAKGRDKDEHVSGLPHA